MKRALERLLVELKAQLETLGVHPVDNTEIELNVTDSEMLKHAQLPFYDPQHCDGFKEFSSEDQELIAQKLVDANKHEFPKNVGIALWNAALRALYMHDSPKTAGLDSSNKDFVDNQYLYMDHNRVTKEKMVDNQIVEKLVTPTNAPNIVDLNTLAFAKSYLKFIDTILNDPNALNQLEANIGWSGKALLKANGVTFADLKSSMLNKSRQTQAELIDRIALFKARLKFNRQTPEERQQEKRELANLEKVAKNSATKVDEQFIIYFNIGLAIKNRNTDITLNDSHISYTQKIAAVKDEIQELDSVIESFPSTETLLKKAQDLIEQKIALPNDPIYKLPENYLLTAARDLEFNRAVNISTIAERVDHDIAKAFNTTIDSLKFYIEESENELSSLKLLKEQLSSLTLALEELNRVSSAINSAKKQLDSPTIELDASTASAQELHLHQHQLRAKLVELKLALNNLHVQKFDNAQLQKEFEAGLKDLGLGAITEKLQAQIKQCESQLQDLTQLIRKIDYAQAHGNVESLVNLKRSSDSSAGVYSGIAREIKNKIMRQQSFSRIAKESIGAIENKYASAIAKTEAAITKRTQIAANNEIRINGSVVEGVERLESLKKHLIEEKAFLEKTGIPVSEEQFEDFKHSLDWNDTEVDQWAYIKNNSTYSWLTRGATRATSAISLTNSPERPLQEAIDARLTAIDASLSAVRALDRGRAHLDRLKIAQENESRPYIYQKADAESTIDAAQKELDLTDEVLNVHKVNIQMATEGFEQLLGNCLKKLKGVELARAALTEVKNEFDQLVKSGRSAFDPNKIETYREFRRLYLKKEGALLKHEEEMATQAKSAQKNPLMAASRNTSAAEKVAGTKNDASFVENVANSNTIQPAANAALFEKYFRHDQHHPENNGLATQYLAKRAAAYSTFDKLDRAVTQGLKFFSCGSSKAKTDQESRTEYLGKIAGALEKYSNTQNIAFLKGAYNLVAKVLNDPNQFRARAAEGSEAHRHSMRALLSDLMADLQGHPGLQPIIANATEEARNQVENPVHWQPSRLG